MMGWLDEAPLAFFREIFPVGVFMVQSSLMLLTDG